MASKYVQDIKKIVGFDRNQSKLNKAERKEKIGSSRGIGYRSQTGNSVGVPSKPDEGSGSTAEPVIDSTNPDLILGSEGISIQSDSSGVIQADANTISNLPDGNSSQLNGIYGLTDPETGKVVDVRLDGYIDSVQGQVSSGDECEVGTKYVGTSGVEGYSASDAGSKHPSRDSINFPYFFSATDIIEPDGTVVGKSVAYSDTENWAPGMRVQVFDFYKQSCTPGSSDSCPLMCPLILDPPVGAQKLTYKDGAFIPNPHQNYVDRVPKLQDGLSSQLNLQFSVDKYLRIEPTKNGGFVVGETDGYKGSYLNDINKVYDANRKFVGIVAKTIVGALLP